MGLDVTETPHVGGHAVDPLRADRVAAADAQLGERGQHAQAGHGQRGHPGHPGGVPECHQVQPAHAPRPSGGGAVFVAGLPDPIRRLAADLRRKRPLAHPAHVQLGDADHLAQGSGCQPGPGQSPARRANARRAVRVGAEVHVQQRRVRPLEQDVLAAPPGVVQHVLRVGDVRGQPPPPLRALLHDRLARELSEVPAGFSRQRAEQAVLERHQARKPRAEIGLVLDVGHAYGGDAVRLVRVARADPAARGADLAVLAGREGTVHELVLDLVVRHHHVRAIADRQSARVDRISLRLQLVHLLDELRGIQGGAVADHVEDAGAQDPGRHQVKRLAPVADPHGVAGVRAAVVAHHHVEVAGQVVDDLALALVPELQSADDAAARSPIDPVVAHRSLRP